MIYDAKILNTITTITFVETQPTLYVSFSFALEENMIDYGFLSGYGVRWLAQILYVFDVKSLEDIYHKKLIVETDEKDNLLRVGCKETGTFFGDLKDKDGKSGQLDLGDFERFEIGKWEAK